MIKTKSMSPISERECYHHQSSTIHATTVMCISCSSMLVWYWHSIFITEHRPTHMTSSDALNSTSSISHPLLVSYSVFFPLSGLAPIYLVSVASKGCHDLMQRKLACKVDYHLIFCHLLVWSPNHGWWCLVLARFCIWITTANVFTHSLKKTSSLTLAYLHGTQF